MGAFITRIGFWGFPIVFIVNYSRIYAPNPILVIKAPTLCVYFVHPCDPDDAKLGELEAPKISELTVRLELLRLLLSRPYLEVLL